MLSLGKRSSPVTAHWNSWTIQQSTQQGTALFLLAGKERMIPDTVSLSFLLALGFSKQGLVPQPLEPLSYPAGETAASAGGAHSLKSKYCCKPFRTSQGERNLCQSLGMHSKHPYPAVRIASNTLKSPRHLESSEIFFSIAYQAVVLKMMSLAAQPAWVDARWF